MAAGYHPCGHRRTGRADRDHRAPATPPLRAVGYGPRLLHRVLRFQRFLAECRTPTARLAELAFRAGYADQAHLSREARVLAGRTPAELRAARLRVRNVQDLSSGIGYNSYMYQPSRD